MNKLFLAKVYAKLYSWSHKIQKRILFISYGGEQYSDSPKVICERMHELYPDFELIFAFKEPEKKDIPTYVKKVCATGREFYQYLTTSFCYVSNEDMHENIVKRKGQYFIQTWHADRPLKKVLYDIENYNGPKIIDNEVTDLCVAGSTYGVNMYRRAFRYSGEILNEGLPRNDFLLNPPNGLYEKTKESLSIANEKKVLLYAPTFRDNKKNGKQNINIDIKKVMNILCKNEEWVCLVRAHQGVEGIAFECDGINFIDVTLYDDITDLLIISDVLITDYSSCATDFVLRRKPVILAVFDMDEYSNKCRNVIDNFENMGFVMVSDQQELNSVVSHLENIDVNAEYDGVNRFCELHESGDSAKRICDIIMRKYLLTRT